ncbi:uncharacterized protein [Drosophila tropicalis]|uniref:uncharacterized protein n=1 Tax=Drosophila tropicalis TaxID=46794 RepID=UPI0035ABE359
MYNFFWFCALCILALCLPLAFSEINSTIVTQIAAGSQQESGDLLPKSEKLILYRLPYTSGINKGSAGKRSKLRRRFNSPASKIKIRPPSHHRHGDTFGYFKPPLSGPPTYSGHGDEPSVPYLDFQHLKLDPHDFRIPPTSYEAQSMDLNFYNEDSDLYGPPKYSAIDFTIDGPPAISSHGSSKIHVPHQKYGLPTIEQSIGPTGYESPPESYISHHAPHYIQPPSEQYGVPAPDSGYINSYAHSDTPIRPPDRDSYSIYEQKVPNVGYHQNFAEPPKPAQTTQQHNPNVHFIHSQPAFEMSSTSYQLNNQQYDQTHQYRVPQSQPPPHGGGSQQPQLPPPPPPPPPSPPQNHQQNSIGYTQIDSHSVVHPSPNYPHEDYAPPSQELPLNPNPKTPGFDYNKSSYEVPIYDAIPFEASNLEEQELYPPIITGKTPIPNNVHPDANTKRRRKRKRRPNPSVPSKKHTLDAPELQQAYDDDSHVRDIDTDTHTDADTDAHGSRYVEHKRKFPSYRPTITTTSIQTTTPAPWSPMQMRTTSSSSIFLPTIVTSTPATRAATRSSIVNRGTSRYHITTPSDHSLAKPISTVTIEKSHSQSYYDGTVAPPPRLSTVLSHQ